MAKKENETSKTEGTEIEPKATRKASVPKPVYVVYKSNEDGDDIDVIDITRNANTVLELCSEAGVKYKMKETIL